MAVGVVDMMICMASENAFIRGIAMSRFHIPKIIKSTTINMYRPRSICLGVALYIFVWYDYIKGYVVFSIDCHTSLTSSFKTTYICYRFGRINRNGT